MAGIPGIPEQDRTKKKNLCTQFTIIIIHIYDITINGIYNFFAIHMLVCSGYLKPETENDIHLDQYIITNTNNSIDNS